MSSNEDHLPVRSPEGLAALEIFYDDFNDIHFFVEDEDQENLYEIVLRKLFPALRIARIIPLGGKQAVLAHALEEGVRVGAPFSVHLLDKDFDDLLGACVNQQTVFYLDKYCIENYFVESDAVIEVVVESLPKQKRRDISAALDVQNKVIELGESSRDLFLLFFCVQRFGLGIKNTGLAAERFCKVGRRWEIDGAAVKSYCEEVIMAASGTVHERHLADPLDHPEIARLRQLDVHQVVSGKHICAMLFHFVKSKYNIGTITFDSFVFRLAKNSSMAPLIGLGNAIRNAAIAVSPRYSTIANVAK